MRTLLSALLLALLGPSSSLAQIAPHSSPLVPQSSLPGPRSSLLPQWELRADATLAATDAAHLGVGLNVRAGWYARLGGALALGVAGSGDGTEVASQRLDLTVRFLLDPFAEYPRGLYGGAGLTARRDGDSRVDTRLLVVIGAEGAPLGGVRPAIELGLGGGVRVGVVLRRLRPGPAR